MKSTMRTLFLMLALLGFVVAGCDDSNDPKTTTDATSTTDATTTDATTTDATTAEDVTTTDVTTTDDVVEDVVVGDACTNAADLAIVSSQDVSGMATTCATSDCISFATSDPPDLPGMTTCTDDCVIAASGVSAGCSTCYSGAVICGVVYCINDCVNNPNSQDCIDCRETNGCTPGFYTCSGLPRN